MMAMILSIDQSTSGTKGLLWDDQGRLVSRVDIPHRQITNDRGWVSHDPADLYHNSVRAAALALEKAGTEPGAVAVIGLSNQRETAVCWDRHTGEALCDAVVWQCNRALDFIREIEYPGFAAEVRSVTGLNLSPYFSAAKFGWMVRNVPAVKAARDRGRLCCGTVDAWLLFKLTGGRVFRTDYSNASRTQLLDLDTLGWNEALVKTFGLTPESLPEIALSDSCFGETSMEGLFKTPVPIHGVLGDSHAALFAHQCLEPYSAKATYGTGTSVMMNAGPRRPAPAEGIVTSLAWGMKDGIPFVLEGNINYSGAVIKWLVEDMELLKNPGDAGEIASSVEDTGGVYLVPAFSGLGAPYFKDTARAALVGMNRGTKRAHLIRAAEECIAYQIRDVIEVMNGSSPRPLAVLKVDGGGCKDRFLTAFQADILGVDLEISENGELSGAGAAYNAAIGAGLAPGEQFFLHKGGTRLGPSMDGEKRDRLYQGWRRAVAAAAAFTL
ncbi:MAG: glycerol kinase [Treponema sp.]|nr:glycerol kinase [Treponema sp.]